MTDQSVETNADGSGATSGGGGGGDIVARAGRYYRNTRYLMCALLVGMGCWFLYDGYVKYPRENQIVRELKVQQEAAQSKNDQAEVGRIAAELKNHEEHNDAALTLQRVLGYTLPPIGVYLLWRSLQNSRGEYRLSGTKLSVPGHPTIDLDDIVDVNNDLWDRKGIAWVDYKTPDGRTGEIKLDDFVYERPPTDEIYDRIAEKMGLSADDDEEYEEGDDVDDEEGTDEDVKS